MTKKISDYDPLYDTLWPKKILLWSTMTHYDQKISNMNHYDTLWPKKIYNMIHSMAHYDPKKFLLWSTMTHYDPNKISIMIHSMTHYDQINF